MHREQAPGFLDFRSHLPGTGCDFTSVAMTPSVLEQMRKGGEVAAVITSQTRNECSLSLRRRPDFSFSDAGSNLEGLCHLGSVPLWVLDGLGQCKH